VFTDKLVAKIPSTHDGVIKSIKYKSDEICLVGHALIEIEVEEDKAAATSAPAKKEEDSSSSSSSSDESGRVGRTKLDPKIEASNHKALATPAVRSIAKKHGIDISKVPATGKDGRVLKEDILAFINGKTS
jgi:2-oxoisovalerate dehydrogenase E2 component (dihydrolipoyl transacylase)